MNNLIYSCRNHEYAKYIEIGYYSGTKEDLTNALYAHYNNQCLITFYDTPDKIKDPTKPIPIYDLFQDVFSLFHVPNAPNTNIKPKFGKLYFGSTLTLYETFLKDPIPSDITKYNELYSLILQQEIVTELCFIREELNHLSDNNHFINEALNTVNQNVCNSVTNQHIILNTANKSLQQKTHFIPIPRSS